MENKKYYWLKLKRDFFKRHDVRIIEEMPNGKDYILFYLKLLLESVDHDGSLRFSDTIPYNEQMLSVVTNTNVDIVRSAMKLFIELNMMSVYDDKTIYMNEVEKLIGSETSWAEKKRLQRTKEDNVPQLSPKCPIEIETYKEKEQNIDNIVEKSRKRYARAPFVPPTFDEVKAYCQERKNDVDPKKFYDYFTESQWVDSKGNKVRNWKQKVISWEGYTNDKKSVGANGIPIEHERSDLDGLF